jgi:hypothetical protein
MSSLHARETKKIARATASTRRSLQFLAALYIHALMLVILIIFFAKLGLHSDPHSALAIASLKYHPSTKI